MSSKRQKIGIYAAVAWLVIGLGIGVLLGRGVREAPRVITGTRAPEVLAARVVPTTRNLPDPRASNISAYEQLQVLSAAGGDPDIASCLHTIAQLTLEECADAVSLLASLPQNERTVLWTAIARRWAELDPEHAFRAAVRGTHNQIKNQLGQAAAAGLVARDPGAALNEISLAKGKFNKFTVANWIVPALARVDPLRAAEFLASEKLFDSSENLYRQVARQYVRASPEAALQWTQSLSSEHLRRESFLEAWRAWSQSDPASAAASVEVSGDEKSRPHLYAAVGQSWSAKDPAAALVWIRSLPDEASREAAFKSFQFNLERIDAGAARDAIESASPTQQRTFASQVATQLARENVQDALAWVNSLSEGKTREAALHKIIEVWSPTEPGEAAAYMAALPESEERTQLVKRAAALWSTMEPDAALDWVKQLPEGKDRDAAMGEAVQAIREEDPKKAMAMLPYINDTGIRQRVAQDALASYAKVDGPAAAAWAETLPGDLQRDAFAGIVRTWASESHEAAGNWVKTLPPGEPRDTAIKAYVSVIDGTDAGMATHWAASIQDPLIKTEALAGTFNRWAEENPSAAGEWLKTAELAEGLRPFFDKFLMEAETRYKRKKSSSD